MCNCPSCKQPDVPVETEVLHAAAPELLEALKELLAEMDALSQGNYADHDVYFLGKRLTEAESALFSKGARETARAAIEKATNGR